MFLLLVVQKPAVIDQYNTHMGGVDRAGQEVQFYGYNNFTKNGGRECFFTCWMLHFYMQLHISSY